jgi:hypothetical protein
MSGKWTSWRTMEPEYIVLTKEEAIDMLNGDSNNKIVIEEFAGKSRWSLHYRVIFERDGNYYETRYRRGATEGQDEQPFEYEDEVKCKRVYPYQEVVTFYK